MSAGHTPGPWTLTHVQGNNFAIQQFEIRGMFGDSPNIDPVFNKDLSAIDGTTIYVSPEDARLIAAAPELLAFVQEWLDREQRDGWEGPYIDEARMLVAKATGAA